MKTIDKITKMFLVLSFLILTPYIYGSEKSVIIVNADIDAAKLSKKDIENIFLGRKTIWNGGKQIHIGVVTNNSETVDHFFEDYIGQSKRRFKKYWLKKVFAGYGIAPKMFNSNQRAIDFAKRQDNSITFITMSGEESIEGLQIVQID